MEIEWNTNYIDPQNLINISKGDQARMERYLRQFMELIPTRVADLKNHLREDNRKMIRQTLHQMSPQLQFFGIPDVVMPIRRLEFEYQTMVHKDLENLINEILEKLDGACGEVDCILRNNFSK
jgi:HPt (histidine-containing phosphotransfer) domain-containing protein